MLNKYLNINVSISFHRSRDTLYRLSYDLKLLQKAVWAPPEQVKQMCLDKGQSEEDCRNYVMLLQVHQNKLYVCGTNAFNPLCAWYTMDTLEGSSFEKGVAKSPFNPRANVTSIVTDNGQLFVATPTDFSGSDPAIVKSELKSSNGGGMLRTVQYNSKWLNDPQFVGSFEAGEFIYFVFRETANEYINCGKSVYSRIARVCKSDPGGTHILRDNWTSFVKARLNCSLPGDYPFYFNEVQGIAYSYQDNTLYATFSTPENSIHGSAVCAFNLTSINEVFTGPFKHQESQTSTWEQKSSHSNIHNECQLARTGHMQQLKESAKYQLMDQAVPATTIHPLHHASSERFSHIALDVISTKLHEKVTMIYVATEAGAIKKISLLPRTRASCVVEVWRPDRLAKESIKILAMQYLKNTDSLYIGTENSVLRLPSHNCQRHVSKSSCLNAMDPYCGWNELLEACTSAPNGDSLTRHWFQNATECPVISAPVDGSWSSWSPWTKCAQNNGQSSADEQNSNTDYCQCRTRTCDNPAPKNGGTGCTGLTIEVNNCTVHGGWTEWSAYSPCSQTCGIAVKTRKRTCSNPKPAFGGRVCVGPDRSDIYCTLSPCPAPEAPQIDGNWGPWGGWGECSAPCGSGFRIRRRKCDDPEPMGGMECVGCNIDYEVCNSQPCAEVKKLGQWTPWLMESNTSKTDEYTERRFRYMCKASVMDATSLKIVLSKEEKRTCQPNGSCQRWVESSK